MTKEELAKKKGIKITKDVRTPAEKLVISKPIEPKPEPIASPVKKEVKPTQPKRSVGKPKKRKDGDKKLSFWIDEDLVPRLYSKLSYGDTAGEFINRALREYLDKY